jgi:hypothetical protein
MVGMDTIEWFYWAGALFGAFCFGLVVEEIVNDAKIHREQQRADNAELEATILRGELEDAEEELRSWKATFDRRVEDKLVERISSWAPDHEWVEDDFKKAEEMAAKRATADAGRKHPPRSDGGLPAKLSRIRFR